MAAPFVLSQDLSSLLRDWSVRHGFCVCIGDLFRYRLQISQVLSQVFESVVIIGETELTFGLARQAGLCNEPVVSLDGVYLSSPWQLGLTRQVDSAGNSLGLGPRHSKADQNAQMQQLADSLLDAGHDRVVLADDVIFAGDLMDEVIGDLSRRGVFVTDVMAGVSIGQGANRIRQQGINVVAVKHFDTVVDEVCERDFLPGAPQSGRTIAPHGKVDAGLPYILPFGDPTDWASVPEGQAQEFSSRCLEAAISLYEAIGERSGRPVKMRDLDRWPGLPSSDCADQSVAEYLKSLTC